MPSKFEIVGFVAYEPKGIGLKVKCLDGAREKTLEVLCFHDEAKGLKVGQEVHVKGELGTKKSEYVREYNGKQYPVYLTQLVAREMKAVPSKQTAIEAAPAPQVDDDIPF